MNATIATGRLRARRMATAMLATALAAGLSGCSLFDDEEILEGERIRFRSEQSAPVSLGGGGAALPQTLTVENWTQTNANPAHNGGHIAGPASLDLAWTRDIGAGASDDGAITSAPIVVNGVVYVLDAESNAGAFSASDGSERWRVSLAPEGESGDEGFGGGLAGDGRQVYATTGFGELLALDPGSGEIKWRREVGAPFRAAPATDGTIVVGVTRDNRAFGLDAGTGEVIWRVPGVSSEAGLLGGASPAIAGGLAVLPFASGELVAVNARTGRRVWSAVLTGGRRGLARASISDVTGDPVAAGPFVIAANQSGRMVAIEGASGRRAWTRSIGSAGPLWVADDTIFAVSDDSRLTRLSARNGATIWEVELPAYEDPEDREGPIGYSGPVLVEGRVLFTSSEGELLSFDGVGGSELARIELSSSSLTGPVVASGTVYVLSDNGVLQAYR